jgi:hypothetical protein
MDSIKHVGWNFADMYHDGYAKIQNNYVWFYPYLAIMHIDIYFFGSLTHI